MFIKNKVNNKIKVGTYEVKRESLVMRIFYFRGIQMCGNKFYIHC